MLDYYNKIRKQQKSTGSRTPAKAIMSRHGVLGDVIVAMEIQMGDAGAGVSAIGWCSMYGSMRELNSYSKRRLVHICR